MVTEYMRGGTYLEPDLSSSNINLPYFNALDKIAWNQRYILAKQRFTESERYVIIDTYDLRFFYAESDSEFLALRAELNIPKELVLKDAESFSGERYKYYQVGSDYALEQYSRYHILITPDDRDNLNTYPHLSDSDETVSELAWDERYVLVKRLGMKRALPEEYKNDYKVPNEEDPHYYILDTVDHVLYGDYDLEAFNAKRQELGISDELKLESYLDYKNSSRW